MSQNLETVESQVINVLKHPEADEGLYLENFHTLHEADEKTNS